MGICQRKKNVKVYCKEVGDQSAFRGKGIIEGTPEKLIGVIHNPKRWKFWIDNLEEGKLLEQKSDFHFVFCRKSMLLGRLKIVKLSLNQ